jgi:hypothetical protein
MAITKTILASASFVQPTNSTANTYTPAGEPIVFNGVLVPSYKVIAPGVYNTGNSISGGAVNEQSSSTAVPTLSNAQQP